MELDQRIAELDLTRLELLLLRDGLPRGEVTTCVVEYRLFLNTVLTSSQTSISPTPAADKAWHAHIVDTLVYMRDCHTLFGCYLHHTPSLSSDTTEVCDTGRCSIICDAERPHEKDSAIRLILITVMQPHPTATSPM
jgi:hypothetical protein